MLARWGRETAEVGGGHLAEDVAACGGRRRSRRGRRRLRGRGGAGLDFEDDEGGAVPGDEVEVAGEALGAPAAGDDGVAEAAEVEEGGVFAALAGEEVGGLGAVAVGAGAEGSVDAAFERRG